MNDSAEELLELIATRLKERRRVRSKTMAKELEISLRTFRLLLTQGMPLTQLDGIQWFEPREVHAWLDQFKTNGAPGIKREKGVGVTL
jgi:hypothetical protein